MDNRFDPMYIGIRRKNVTFAILNHAERNHPYAAPPTPQNLADFG
jgi:hypothetical protein